MYIIVYASMDNFLLIDFTDFRLTEVCGFVMEQLHSRIHDRIIYLNNIILSNSLKKKVYHSAFHLSYLDLVDKIQRLLKMEKHVLFEYVQASEQLLPQVSVPDNSRRLIRQFQYDIKRTLLNTRVLFQELEKDAGFRTMTSIIDMELHNLETNIIQWFHIVNKNILGSNQLNK